jgi:hypothetical protein
MTRLRLVASMTVGLLMLGVTPAHAGFWAWLEEFSGPGPLKGYTVLSTFCVQDGTRRFSPIALEDTYHVGLKTDAKDLFTFTYPTKTEPTEAETRAMLRKLLANPDIAPTVEELRQAPDRRAKDPTILRLQKDARAFDFGEGHTDPKLVCGYFDFGRFRSNADPDRGFPNVSANFYDFGPSVRLHDGLDFGGGFGFVTIDSHATTGTVSTTKATITPFRSVIRPILIAVPEHYRKAWMGVFSLYWKETYVAGELTGADFGNPDVGRISDGELVRSFGMILDASALLSKFSF